MPRYDVLYAMMFETMSGAIREMEQMNFGRAKAMLVEAREHGIEVCGLSDIYEGFRADAIAEHRDGT